MLVKFSFISIVLALAAAQELYDRFDVRDAIEDVVDEYINARDVLWEDRDLIERAVRTTFLLLLFLHSLVTICRNLWRLYQRCLRMYTPDRRRALWKVSTWNPWNLVSMRSATA